MKKDSFINTSPVGVQITELERRELNQCLWQQTIEATPVCQFPHVQ